MQSVRPASRSRSACRRCGGKLKVIASSARFAILVTTGTGVTEQRWMTFMRNHADAIVACDFFTVVTATFKVFYVFIVVEHATRRILRFNVTRHPTGDWTLQQLSVRMIGTIRRECLDYLIPLGERHLSRVLAEWARHYNAAGRIARWVPVFRIPPDTLR